MASVLLAAAVAACIASTACRPGVRVGSPCRSAPVFAPFDDHRPTLREAAAPEDALEGTRAGGTERRSEAAPDGLLDAIVAWYQHHGRTRELPGAGCRFAPTCSAYARTALQRYGPIAVILIVDRLLVREHVLAGEYYPVICVEHTTRLDDGVP
jgi:putative component of membrane protein insertase Oxa1/YidC/SpoIIIJ protein YidD